MDIYIYDFHITLPFLNSPVRHHRFALPKQETGMPMAKQLLCHTQSVSLLLFLPCFNVCGSVFVLIAKSPHSANQMQLELKSKTKTTHQ